MPESIRQKATNKLAKPNLPNILRLVVTPKSRKKPIAQDELSKIQIPAYGNRERPPLDQDRFGPLSVSPWLEKPWELREFLASSLFQILGSPWETQKTNGLALADELVGLAWFFGRFGCLGRRKSNSPLFQRSGPPSPFGSKNPQ
jgi:hypothetical protein